MRRNCLPLAVLAISAFGFLNLPTVQAQNSTEIYKNIKDDPSKTRWCLRESGDDPSGIIGGRCEVYSNCLGALGLDASVDRRPYPALSDAQVLNVKKCHQALYNAARTNPQLKGSKATQEWLEQDVYSGTEAKSFPIPGSMSHPH